MLSVGRNLIQAIGYEKGKVINFAVGTPGSH